MKETVTAVSSVLTLAAVITFGILILRHADAAEADRTRAHGMATALLATHGWEYRVDFFPETSSTIEPMTALGRVGWEIIETRRARGAGDIWGVECTFRRPTPIGAGTGAR